MTKSVFDPAQHIVPDNEAIGLAIKRSLTLVGSKDCNQAQD